MATKAPALSPSRANDFKQCPLMFRLRVIDQVPEPPSPAATLGTLVHAVLEHLFTVPSAERTESTAHAMIEPTWRAMVAKDAALMNLHHDAVAEQSWLNDAATRLSTYFTMENPQRLEPQTTEEFVEIALDDGPLLRGVIDRVDVAPDGSIRIIDYKTGKAPLPQYSSDAYFQMRFYALLMERSRGRVPSVLQLLYLRDGATVAMHPTSADLERIEMEIRDLWNDITAAAKAGHFRARRSALCSWCHFKVLCPEFGNQPPALDPAQVQRALGVTPGT